MILDVPEAPHLVSEYVPLAPNLDEFCRIGDHRDRRNRRGKAPLSRNALVEKASRGLQLALQEALKGFATCVGFEVREEVARQFVQGGMEGTFGMVSLMSGCGRNGGRTLWKGSSGSLLVQMSSSST